MKTIVVTGASGFVGRALVQAALERGDAVTAVTRGEPSGPTHPRLRHARVSEIDAHTNWDEALRGADVVIHAAGRAHVMRETALDPLQEFRRVNRDGTARLAASAAALGVRRFVFVSSIKVNGERTTLESPSFSEEDVAAPADAYGMSKLEGEQALWSVAASTGLAATVVRPPLVIGPGVRANFLSLIRAVERRLPLPLASIDNRRSLIGLENLVDLLLLCAQHPNAEGQLFVASEERAVSTAELVRLIAHAFGRPARLVPMPAWTLEAVATVLGRQEQARRLCESLVVDSSKAVRLLDWRRNLTLLEGIRRTVDWYLNRPSFA